jgi:hypothetical protein
MAKIIINGCEYEVSESLVQSLQEAADDLGVPVGELASEVLTDGLETSPEIERLVREAEAEANRRGITMEHYIAEAEHAGQMTTLLIKMLKTRQ